MFHIYVQFLYQALISCYFCEYILSECRDVSVAPQNQDHFAEIPLQNIFASLHQNFSAYKIKTDDNL